MGLNNTIEDKLWKAAEELRINVDAAEYKHIVLGLFFLKFLTDNQENNNHFFIPKEANWNYILSQQLEPKIGEILDKALIVIEQNNSKLKNILPIIFGNTDLDNKSLSKLIGVVDSIQLVNDKEDILGKVYEYFLGQFAKAEGKNGGQFYTPQCIVKLLVDILEPYKGKVYDPCCGSGGMFVQSEKFIKEHHGQKDDIQVYGQEANPTTWRLCNMNLVARGLDSEIALGNTFSDNQHSDLKADYIIANPPFNIKKWGFEQLKTDKRWTFGIPPKSNANFAWIQHIIAHLSEKGKAGVVLTNGSLSATAGAEGRIRKNLIKANLVECIITLPKQLFYNTQIPACLWFFSKEKQTNNILFINGNNLGKLISRTQRELSNEDIKKIVDTYHAWKNQEEVYKNVSGFCFDASPQDLRNNNYLLTPGIYVGVPSKAKSNVPLDVELKKMMSILSEKFEKSRQLDEQILNTLQALTNQITYSEKN